MNDYSRATLYAKPDALDGKYGVYIGLRNMTQTWYNYRSKPHKSGTAMLVTSGALADSLRKDSISMQDHTTRESTNEIKYCECGCGQPAPISKSTDKKYGAVKGKPRRFIVGHNGRRDPVAYFWKNVDRRDPDDCWFWRAQINGSGYGRLRVDGTDVLAHRFSYELHNAPIPDDMCVLHNCPDGDNPACVNPAHLWIGTRTDNMADRDEKGRQAKGVRQGSVKLTPEKVRHIRTLHKVGMFPKGIAARFGVSSSTIRAIVTGRTWAHVE